MDQIIQQLERISLNLDDLEKTLCDGIDAIFLKYAANFNKKVDTDASTMEPYNDEISCINDISDEFSSSAGKFSTKNTPLVWPKYGFKWINKNGKPYIIFPNRLQMYKQNRVNWNESSWYKEIRCNRKKVRLKIAWM